MKPTIEEIKNKYPAIEKYTVLNSVIYFLIKSKVVVYIGTTTALPGRLSFHKKYSEKDFDTVYFLKCKTPKKTEKELIQKYKPIYNKQRLRNFGGKLYRYTV